MKALVLLMFSVLAAGMFSAQAQAQCVDCQLRAMSTEMDVGNSSVSISTPMANVSITSGPDGTRRITTPAANITVTSGPNNTRTVSIENREQTRTITIDPNRERIMARLHNDSSTETEINATRFRARIRTWSRECGNDCPNVSIEYNMSLKRVRIQYGNLSAFTNQTVEVDNGTVYIQSQKTARKELKVLPENASSIAMTRVNYHIIKAVDIESYDDEVFYSVRGVQRGKILGLFDVDMGVEAHVDVENASVMRVSRPWWSFLVF